MTGSFKSVFPEAATRAHQRQRKVVGKQGLEILVRCRRSNSHTITTPRGHAWSPSWPERRPTGRQGLRPSSGESKWHRVALDDIGNVFGAPDFRSHDLEPQRSNCDLNFELGAVTGFPALPKAAMRVRPGTISRRSSSRLPARSVASCEIAARSRKTRHNSAPKRVIGKGKDDWDDRGRLTHAADGVLS
jgi:hypothetical protein